MLRLQNHFIYALRTASPLPTSFRRRRLLCATASPAHFVAEDYLVTTCGLTPAQALKASKYLSHHKTPNKLDAVRAFLADLGLSKADVAATVARYPRLLCCSVDKTLAPKVARLRDIGLSTPQIARLIALVPGTCTSPAHISRLAFYVSLLGSYDKVLVALKRSPYLLDCSPENAVKPNLALLRQCGLTVGDIAKVFLLIPQLVVGPQERLKAVMVRAEELGAPRGTPMFRHALVAAYSVRRESATAKMELLESLGWSSDQVAKAVAKCPSTLFSSEDRLRRAVNFLTKEAGVEVETIARRPMMLKFSLERRLVPRLKVLKLLKEKGLQGGNRRLQGVASMSEEIFAKTFVHPHEESVPALTDAYAAARAGKAPVAAAS